jgi:hypothetical protein
MSSVDYRKKSIRRTPIYWGWLLPPKSYDSVIYRNEERIHPKG